MGEITLIRHGQANSHAQDEASYDRLSDLGWQQSRWLGDYFRAFEAPFDRVVHGSLRRHRETYEGLGLDLTAEEDARLDEMDYFTLGGVLEEKYGVPFPTSESFHAHIPQVLEAWEADHIRGRESFASFAARVDAVVQDATEPGKRVLLVTSGGVIGMVLRGLLGLDPHKLARILLPIHNSSVHKIRIEPHGPVLWSFNGIPHLQATERAHARTTF